MYVTSSAIILQDNTEMRQHDMPGNAYGKCQVEHGPKRMSGLGSSGFGKRQ